EVCDGIDNDCDGGVDEGFPDTDRDGLADCIDPDDDNDCVLDGADNCPTVVNANQYCPQADLGHGPCGEFCKSQSADFRDAVLVLSQCWLTPQGLGGVDPQCRVDGCPGP